MKHGSHNAAETLRDWQPKVPMPDSEARIAAAAEAFQDRWNDWCIDTGCHPDFIYREGRSDAGIVTVVGLDTDKAPFDDFMRSALVAADVVQASEAEQLRERFDAMDAENNEWMAEVDRLRTALQNLVAKFDHAIQPNDHDRPTELFIGPMRKWFDDARAVLAGSESPTPPVPRPGLGRKSASLLAGS